MSYENIEVRTEAGKVGIVTLNRPKQLNALNDLLMDELGAALKAFDGNPPVGVTLFVEHEEEIGSPSMTSIIEAHKDELAADVIVVADSVNWDQGEPSVTTTLRGVADCVVELRTLDHPLHSGQFGGVVPDALTAMCKLLATLHDENGDVAVAGLHTAEPASVEYPEERPRTETAILDGAAQIVTPAFVSLLCICIVFVPMFFLPGVSGFLFVPMALAVVYAMISSFILSRTLVPTMANYLLTPHDPGMEHAAPGTALGRFQQAFERRFIAFRAGYLALLDWAMESRKPFIAGFLAIMLGSLLLTPFLGRNFFPSVDSGQMLIHVRVPVGTRIEESAASFDRIGKAVREIVPPAELGSIINNIGLPTSALNTAYANTGSIGPQDGDILITLARGHGPTASHIDRLRRELPARFPGVSFAFLPADMTSQILNFGAPAPIDIRISGNKLPAVRDYAEKLRRKVQLIPGIADVRIQQPARAPQFDVDVDRSRIGQYGLTERDVTTSLGGTLAGTAQSSPVFFINPQNGVSYPVVAQTPEHMVDTISALENVPVSAVGVPSQVLGGVAEASRSNTVPVVSRYALKPVINIFATTDKRDLGAVAGDVQKAINELQAELPDGVTVTIGGQYQTMQTAFIGLGLGIAAAVILIYLLIVVNFQSWIDPFVIISALPAALAGIVWMLFITGTTLSVPALTGAIMCMGVATANSILVVSFARERLALHGDAARAAVESAHTRFRPVLMTALAMMLGMLPMALGLGEGGEQNAPLGRAVIGGLLFATVATLFFVPTLFSIVHGRRASDAAAPHGPAHLGNL